MGGTETIVVSVKEREGFVPLGALRTAVDTLDSLLRELDRAARAPDEDTIEWAVSELRQGSATVGVVPMGSEAGLQRSGTVCGALVDGLSLLERLAERPRYFSDAALDAAKRLASVVDGRVREVEVRFGQTAVSVTRRVYANAAELIDKVQYALPGYVEGKLELLSIHGQPRFGVWEPVSQRQVKCFFEPRLLSEVVAAIGQRVAVFGEVRFSKEGHPLNVRVQGLQQLPDDSELPPTRRMVGLAPDITGGLESGEYVRRMRDA